MNKKDKNKTEKKTTKKVTKNKVAGRQPNNPPNKTKKLINKMGGAIIVAQEVGLYPGSVYLWINKDRIPPYHARTLYNIFGKSCNVKLHELDSFLWKKGSK